MTAFVHLDYFRQCFPLKFYIFTENFVMGTDTDGDRECPLSCSVRVSVWGGGGALCARFVNNAQRIRKTDHILEMKINYEEKIL